MKYEKLEKLIIEFTIEEIKDFNKFYCELSIEEIQSCNKIIEKIYNVIPSNEKLDEK